MVNDALFRYEIINMILDGSVDRSTDNEMFHLFSSNEVNLSILVENPNEQVSVHCISPNYSNSIHIKMGSFSL